MKLYSEHFQSAYAKALSFLNHITDSSRLGTLPSRDVLSFLRATVRSNVSYTVYRGLALDELSSDVELYGKVPEQYLRPLAGPVCIHTTDDIDVALGYASGRKTGFVYRMTCLSDYVLFDSNRATAIFPDLPEDLKDYFRESGEILLDAKAYIKDSRVMQIMS